MDNWWRSLQVGDFVCDCRFKHLRITKIQPTYRDRYYLNFYLWVPDWIPNWLDDLLWRLQTKFPASSVWVDSHLTLEDGASCSAVYCCDPVNHSQPHPEQIRLDLERKDSYREGDLVRFHGRYGTGYCYRADGTGSSWEIVKGTVWYVASRGLLGYNLDDRCRQDITDGSEGPWFVGYVEGVNLEPVNGEEDGTLD